MALANTRNFHAKLEGLVGEMDDLESGFDQRVELSRISGKRFLLLDDRTLVVLSLPRLALLARHGGCISTCRECITLTVPRLLRRIRTEPVNKLLARR